MCSDYYRDYVEPTPEHEYWVLDVVDPTCTRDGHTVYWCDCGSNYVDRIIPAMGHEFTEVVSTVSPSCATAGYTVYKCTACNTTHNEENTPPLAHNYVVAKVVDPTYDAEGYTVYVCQGCGDSYHGDYTEKLQPDDPANEHVCSGACHEEIRQGGYTYVYCDTIEAPYLSKDGFTVYYPYEYYF
jgi:DNA-directed RNA polymerase subunit RPC12/RpoP